MVVGNVVILNHSNSEDGHFMGCSDNLFWCTQELGKS